MVKLTLVDGEEAWVNPAHVARVSKDTRWAGEADQNTHVHMVDGAILVMDGTPEEIAKLLSPAAPPVVNVVNTVPNPAGKPGRPADHAAEHLQ